MKIINGKVFDTNKKTFIKDSLCFENTIGKDDGGVIDAQGCFVVPGYIDIHTHGYGGIDFMTSNDEEIINKSVMYAQKGTTTVFATLVSSPLDKTSSALENIKKASKNAKINIDGIYFEGPYISHDKSGCHKHEYIKDVCDFDEIKDLILNSSPFKTYITVAPEKEGAEDFIKNCVKHGVTVAIGHSGADYKRCHDALSWGVKAFTHTFNAMSPILHREPNTAGASLMSDAYSEFICDGFHVCPEIMDMAYKLKGEDKFVCVTDSLPCAGLCDGEYMFFDLPVTVNGKKILTKGGTVAGSGADMHTCVLNLMKFADIPYEKAVLTATANPARTVGIFDFCGSLEYGKRADILLVDSDTYEIKKVIVGGRIIS